MINHSDWCFNRLSVSGEDERVRLFIEENKSEGTDGYIIPIVFDKSVPEPAESKDWDDTAIYIWRVENWGAKWNPNFNGLSVARKDSIKIEEKTVSGKRITIATYGFNTACDSASAWVERVSLKYQTLSFCLTYGEATAGFGGSLIYHQGDVIDSSKGRADDYLKESELLSLKNAF